MRARQKERRYIFSQSTFAVYLNLGGLGTHPLAEIKRWGEDRTMHALGTDYFFSMMFAIDAHSCEQARFLSRETKRKLCVWSQVTKTSVHCSENSYPESQKQLLKEGCHHCLQPPLALNELCISGIGKVQPVKCCGSTMGAIGEP